MGDLGHVGARASWGPAEQAAMERCLTVPGLSERRRLHPTPVRLSRTIETEIIPRLMLAHLAEAGPRVGSPELTSAEVRDFTRIVLEREVEVGLAHIGEIRAAGHSIEAVFLDLLAPTARLLGDMWEDDLCSFTDVTIGLSRLQQILRELSGRFESETQPSCRGRILLSAVPGEQHSFGISMLESFFRRAGWDVCGGGAHSDAELLAYARDEWLDAIGLSLSSDILYERVRALIPALRRASCNPSVYVLVGGRYFTDHPELAIQVGADTAAADAPDALRRADTCLGFEPARG